MYQVDVANEEAEETRWNNSESVVPLRAEEMDERDLLQIALDQICDFQRQLQQENEADERSMDDGSEMESDDGYSEEREVDDDGDEDDGEVPLCDIDDVVVTAGFQFCAKEALRFLVEDEQLVPEHPMVQQLNAHLQEQNQGLDCAQVLSNYMASTSSGF